MPAPKPVLRREYVDRIFERLTVLYGSRFRRRWDGMDIEVVKRSWALELGRFDLHPHAIAYAMEHLPPAEPPTVMEFRALCRQAPPTKLAALPAPVNNNSPAAREALAKLRGLAARMTITKSTAQNHQPTQEPQA